MNTPLTDRYYATLRDWADYCKRYPNMPPEQADQCPIPCTEEEFARALEISRAELMGALERISHAKPDRLDHSIDICIVERAAAIAKAALSRAREFERGRG